MDAISSGLRDHKIYLHDPAEKSETGKLSDKIRGMIADCDFLIAKTTTEDGSDHNNPNVWYEIGYAHALGKPVMFLRHATAALSGWPVDVRENAFIDYEDYPHLAMRLHHATLKEVTQP